MHPVASAGITKLPRCKGQPQPGRGLTGTPVAGPGSLPAARLSTGPWRAGNVENPSTKDWPWPCLTPEPRSLYKPRHCSRQPLRLPREMNGLNRAPPAPHPQAADSRAETQPQPRRAHVSQQSPAPPATSEVIADWDHRNAPCCAKICQEQPPQETRFRQAAWLTPTSCWKSSLGLKQAPGRGGCQPHQGSCEDTAQLTAPFCLSAVILMGT